MYDSKPYNFNDLPDVDSKLFACSKSESHSENLKLTTSAKNNSLPDLTRLTKPPENMPDRHQLRSYLHISDEIYDSRMCTELLLFSKYNIVGSTAFCSKYHRSVG